VRLYIVKFDLNVERVVTIQFLYRNFLVSNHSYDSIDFTSPYLILK